MARTAFTIFSMLLALSSGASAYPPIIITCDGWKTRYGCPEGYECDCDGEKPVTRRSASYCQQRLHALLEQAAPHVSDYRIVIHELTILPIFDPCDMDLLCQKEREVERMRAERALHEQIAAVLKECKP